MVTCGFVVDLLQHVVCRRLVAACDLVVDLLRCVVVSTNCSMWFCRQLVATCGCVVLVRQ